MLAWLVFNGTIANLPGKLVICLVAFIVLDLICVVVAGQLWKQANHIDPPSEANKVTFFLKSQLGAILSAVAFLPVLILMATDEDADPQTKKIGAMAAAIALAIGMGSSIDFHPVSAEDLAEAEETAIALGDGTVYWTPYGHVYHLNPDCQAIVNSPDIYRATCRLPLRLAAPVPASSAPTKVAPTCSRTSPALTTRRPPRRMPRPPTTRSSTRQRSRPTDFPLHM